ncbi:MAG: hypothetical protein K8I82_26605 [Anaerolineae bacterium]|jgi:hypothetical protein|nr:hypothetical protein [Anaerolineae bacterium]
MNQVWKLVYKLEIAAAVSVLLSLAMPWHTVHGSGVQTLAYGFSREAAMLIVNYGRMTLYVSSWMLLMVIPLLAILFGIRGALGVMTLHLSNDSFLRLLVIFMAASTVWYWQANPEHLASGFWLCGFSVALLCLAMVIEFNLPEEKVHEKRSIRDLMKSNLPEGFIACPHCGAPNNSLEDFCIFCNGWLGKEE